LLGTARKIAYANKKYHSGTICTGIVNKSASINISGSPNLKGYLKINKKKIKKIKTFIKSFDQ
jgi:hypothetical protein